MEKDYSQLYSQRAREMKASEIRELLKLTQMTDIISFAGGLPSPDAFPIDIVNNICQELIVKDGKLALQYAATEGVTKLREVLADRMNRQGMDITHRNVLVTTGAQQGLDLIGKTFLDPGDIVVLGAPTYLGGTNAFAAYMAKMESIPLDENGMNPDVLDEKLHHLHRHGKNPKLLYVVPTFQNPSGVTMPENRRRQLLEIAYNYDLLVVEDNPYSELRYEGDNIPSIMSLDTEEKVIYLGTCSKILAPGLRVAWTVAPKPILNKLVITKQSTDLCSSTFCQYVAYEYIAQGYLDKHIEVIKALYKKKRDIMLASLEKYFPEGTTWTKPLGGMFLWVTLPEYIDTGQMVERAIENKVAYVIGSAFHADRNGINTMRLNFTYSSDEFIEEGIKRLADTIKAEIEAHEKRTRESPYKPDKDGIITGV